MGELADRTRRFWMELWNHRAMDEMLAELDPAFVMADHRALRDSGVTRNDWEELTRSWWELVPDLVAVEFEPLAEEPGRLVHYLLFTGHDALSGGAVEVPFYVVNSADEERFVSAHLFDDRDAAMACYAALAS